MKILLKYLDKGKAIRRKMLFRFELVVLKKSAVPDFGYSTMCPATLCLLLSVHRTSA